MQPFGSRGKVSQGNVTVVLGAGGLLGSAIVSKAATVITPESRSLMARIDSGDIRPVAEILRGNHGPQDWIYAIGLIDPRANQEALLQVNVSWPTKLRSALEEAARAEEREKGSLRLVTLGSVMEDRAAVAQANSYIDSKARLRRAYHERPRPSPVAWAHIQLHTIYGGERPHSFMFLGQIEAALRTRTPFRMSSGRQLREYLHVDDAARAICQYLLEHPRVDDSFRLSTGKAVRLRTVAEEIFAHFGLQSLFEPQSFEEQPGENYDVVYDRWPGLRGDREPIAGIIAWLEELGVRGGRP